MSRRTALAVVGVLVVYGLVYLFAWSVVWRVPEFDRDGIEWVYVFVMTLPWSVFAGAGVPVVHAGAVVNAVLIAAFAGWKVRRTAG